jgi:hypothetical protein
MSGKTKTISRPILKRDCRASVSAEATPDKPFAMMEKSNASSAFELTHQAD